MKKKRDNIVKKIGRETTIAAKLEMAMGHSKDTMRLENQRDCHAIINRARWLVGSKHKPEVVVHHLAKIGYALVSAIVQGNHAVIQSLATNVQYPKPPKQSELHRNILIFCECLDCGTIGDPAPAKALVSYLKRQGHRFSAGYDKEIPRSLVTTCEKIGVWLVNR